MDDQALLGVSQAKVDQTLTQMKALGAKRVRVSAFWSDIAPAPTSTTRPARFDPSYPNDPSYRWAALDRVVASAAQHGLHVLISISTPIPYWASTKPSMKNNVWSPAPKQFGAFVYAVAARYGSVADQFAMLNEPNQGAWLEPQSLHGRLVAPHLYRALLASGQAAVRLAAPKAVVIGGELASSGRDDRGLTRPIRPLLFLREMACRDARYRRIRTGRCKGARTVGLAALGLHPYSLFQSPFQHSVKRDDAAIGDWRHVNSTLARLVRARAIHPAAGARRVPIYYTEFGYQTDPPDPFAGIPLSRQSRWLQDAAYVAWATPNVKALNQFRVTDGRIRGKGPLAFREFQSGLFFANGKAKPSAATFPNPIVVRPSGRSLLLVWGQVRIGGRHEVTVERRSGKRFAAVATARTDSRGYFAKHVRRRAGTYRFRWPGGHSGTERVR